MNIYKVCGLYYATMRNKQGGGWIGVANSRYLAILQCLHNADLI